MLLAMMLLTSPLAQGNTYTKGIDVSHHNGDIEWNKVAQQDIRFAYIKASESTDFKDEKFEVNIKDATSKYIWAGAYHYARPNEGNDAADEARWFVNVAGNYITPGYLRPALDIEWDPDYGDVKDSEYLKNWIDTWMSTVKDMTGVEPIIYTHHYYVAQCLSGETSLANYDLWMADTTSSETPDLAEIWSTWIVWQYHVGSAGSVNGIDEEIDLDYLNDNIGGLSYLAIPNPDGYAFGEWTLHYQWHNPELKGDYIKFFRNDGTYHDNIGSTGNWIQNGDAVHWKMDYPPASPSPIAAIFDGTIKSSTMSGTCSSDSNNTGTWSADKRYYGTTENLA